MPEAQSLMRRDEVSHSFPRIQTICKDRKMLNAPGGSLERFENF